MQVLDLKELVRKSKGVSEEEVQRAMETIRRVEQLGGVRSQYNLAPPFARQGRLLSREAAALKPPDPRTVKLKIRR